MRELKTNTATRVTVGPFLDKGDFFTPETGITVTSCKLTAVVDDAGVPTLVLDTAPTASGGDNDMVHITGDDSGYYDLELTAANLNYLGRLAISINDAAVHLPVFHEFMIVSAAYYDWKYGSTIPPVNSTQFAGQTITAAAGVTLPSSVASPTNITAGTITTTTNLTNAPPDSSGVTTLLSRLSSARAGYLDNLSAGAVALEASLQALITTIGASAAGVATAVWGAATRLLTAGTNIVLAKGTGVTGFTDLSAAQVNAEVDTALADYDPPTRTEATSDKDAILTAVGDVPTNSELTTALNTLLTTALTESYSADGATMTPAQALYEIRALLSEFAITGTTMSVKKKDGTTEAFVLTLNDGTSPTAVTRSS